MLCSQILLETHRTLFHIQRTYHTFSRYQSELGENLFKVMHKMFWLFPFDRIIQPIKKSPGVCLFLSLHKHLVTVAVFFAKKHMVTPSVFSLLALRHFFSSWRLQLAQLGYLLAICTPWGLHSDCYNNSVKAIDCQY